MLLRACRLRASNSDPKHFWEYLSNWEGKSVCSLFSSPPSPPAPLNWGDKVNKEQRVS